MASLVYTIRAAVGGYIVQAVDGMEDEEEAGEEIVFTTKRTALEYLRCELDPEAGDPTADPTA